jgi:hypothetical protein
MQESGDLVYELKVTCSKYIYTHIQEDVNMWVDIKGNIISKIEEEKEEVGCR